MPTDQLTTVLTKPTDTQHEAVAAKIIPLRVERWEAVERVVVRTHYDQGRHFLKVALPAVPVAVFTLVFLLCYCIAATDATRVNRPIDPAPPFFGSLIITIIISALCASIYSGYRHVTGLNNAE